MYNPVSTYRIQFSKDYPFKKFREDLGYFLLLNPGSIYSSPFFEAVPGSMHGYDVTNPLSINHEIGTYKEFVEIVKSLKPVKTGWIQDIVPNHMAYHMNNLWLMDVLENGKSSKYSDFFDIDFTHPDHEGRLMVPFLGKQPKEAINDGEITVDWFNGSLIFRYFDYFFPFSFDSFRQIVVNHLASAPGSFHKIWYDFSQESEAEFLEKVWPELRDKIEKLHIRLPSFKKFINGILEAINNDNNLIEDLLDQQNYQLCHWRDSTKSLNYRRFFTVNGLLCLKMENDHVFDEYHRFIEEQVKKNIFQGLRIDHIDGLRLPVHYLGKLRVLAGDKTYIVAEKILEKDEKLLSNLPVQGTSGYDYLGIVNNLFTWRNDLPGLDKFYRDITGIKQDIEDIIYEKKKFILTERMNGELDNLVRMFEESDFITYDKEITSESIKQAIGEFLIFFPFYKVYSDHLPLFSGDEEIVRGVLEKANRKNPSLSGSLLALEKIFLSPAGYEPEKSGRALDFFLRCMQFTGPLMAKGVEDTVMYHYNSFISHNEVGDQPGSQGISAKEYHEKMIDRQRYWPMAMNATSTHDTKRGEDVRARLNVISEMAREWILMVEKWMSINKKHKKRIKGINSPTNNEEYFLYQTLAGVFPFEGNPGEMFFNRMDEYIVKSLRETKTNSNWNEPNEDHERAVINFIRQILRSGSTFLESFIPFQQKISGYGIVNSLSQVMLKATSPGVPDFYQGTELWDLSMVDPDNRRPVDYRQRIQFLKEIIEKDAKDANHLFYELWANRSDGRIKLWLTWKLMNERKSDPELFLHGNYIPLMVKGKYKDHVIAFARNHGSRWIIVIVPLFLAKLEDKIFIKGKELLNWENTIVILPDTMPQKWTTSYGGSELKSEGELRLSEIMKYACPVLLKGRMDDPVRSAGVLIHISSLPGKYGTGDLGDEAYEFADLLNRAGQSYWQILPFNPVGRVYGYSPYSSTSAFAGNLMFLSPDSLMKARLVDLPDIPKMKFRETNKTDFINAIELRNKLLGLAYSNFIKYPEPVTAKGFKDFCELERYWLDDYALFVNLKDEHKGIPWNEWPENLKSRETVSLNNFRRKYHTKIEIEKFGQYLFNVQWMALKKYCNNLGIKIIGDMSFYVNYDSAEVWANPSYFKLDDKKEPLLVGGVPPDFFSSTGQLWNMPVYNWEFMKEDGYRWWLNRIKRNMELCDLVRFDHFRGFSEYWEVPAGEKTAENGKWTAGPGMDFLGKVSDEFSEMPFIAEDLGFIDDKVYKLRDSFSLPGMVILQFAFGENTPRSGYIPHNYNSNCIVYTGTHDNNTTKGWYLNELSDKNRKEAEEYVGHKIDGELCHDEFIRMAYSSVARLAVIPVQDFLGLNENARLNKPSTSKNNWNWKLTKKDLKNIPAEKIRRLAFLFGRL